MAIMSKLSIVLIAMFANAAFAETQLSVKAGADYRGYLQTALETKQAKQQFSLFIEPELYYSWNDDLDNITFTSFYRWDSEDNERNHGDIRELMWLHVGDDWEMRTGIGRVFWGQTESAHLVDVINQTDGVEAVDGEDKLGQPMLNLTLIREWGNVDLFILPGFRERTFTGEKGRLRLPFIVDTDNPQYQSSDEEKHIDFAARWSHSIDNWELGISYFKGTSRDAILNPVVNNTHLSFQPYYAQIAQVGVDMLAVIDSWLYKFEGIYRDSDNRNNIDIEDYFAMTTGFEYTVVGVFDSVWDIGWLMEYQYDNRGQAAASLGQNDMMIGARLVLNDIDGSEVLFGMTQDLDDKESTNAFVEASSRINDNWKWRVDARLFSASDRRDLSYHLRQDDHIELSLEYYF